MAHSYGSEILRQGIKKISSQYDCYKVKMIEDYIGNFLLRNDIKLDFNEESIYTEVKK